MVSTQSNRAKMGSDKKGSGFFTKSLVVLAIAIAIPVYRTMFNSGDPISYLLPNFLLFTPYRDLTKKLWEERIKIDKNVRYTPQHIPEIDARDYTFESLRAATENFRYPAVIRGIFNNTPAQQKWITLDYLPSRIGSYKIPVVGDATVGKLQNDRSVRRFDESFTEIITNENSKAYLFFPVKSRFNFNGSDVGSLEALQKEIDDIVVEDLQLDRIWKGFGTKAHKSYYGSQLIIGQGSDDSEATTGTGWHCAAGNNWFAQVVGTKRWYFMDPKYSALMHPLRGGKVNMMTGTRRMAEFQPHIPLRYADIRAGDLLYNPDWEWHTIRNFKGLSIGVPIREVNISLSIQNNAHYTAIVTLNRVADRFGINIGGYPPN